MQLIKKRALLYAALVAFLTLCAFVFRLYIDYSSQEHEARMRAFFDYQIKQLNKNIEDAKRSSMAIAVLLGRNDAIQRCMARKDREECIRSVSELIGTLGAVSMYKNIMIHLHTDDLHSFVRSWNLDKFGDKLSGFRYLISEAIEHKRPVAGIESGVAGVFIRAVSGISEGERSLGSVEVLLNYEHIGNFFKEQGIDLFVLLDKNDGVYRQHTPNDRLLDGHYIQNLTSANLNVLELLREIDLESHDFYASGTHFFSIVPLIDASGKRIGRYVLHVNENDVERAISQNYMAF